MFEYGVRVTVERNGREEILYFSVQAPGISDAKNLVFLIVGGEPIHWVIEKK